MATLQSYDLNGQKLSFANWVSNITPTDTPFLSMTKKESINQTVFHWQTDVLHRVEDNAQLEGWESGTASSSFKPTKVLSNYTQILRKVISVSDTAEAVETYGRESEISYQMEKAVKELKRDLEYAFLNNLMSSAGDINSPRKTGGYPSLCTGIGSPDSDTGAVLNFDVQQLDEESLLEMCKNLYMNGSNANVIMFHPVHAKFFSKLQETATRKRLFDNTPVYDILVNMFKDQFGRDYKLVPNRNMSKDKVFFFDPSNWSQKVLRPPQRKKLAKMGSFTQWMIEMEVGLAHVNPEASGILNIRETARMSDLMEEMQLDNSGSASLFGTNFKVQANTGDTLKFMFKGNTNHVYHLVLYKDEEVIQVVQGIVNSETKEYALTSAAAKEHSGVYKFILIDSTTHKPVDESASMTIEII